MIIGADNRGITTAQLVKLIRFLERNADDSGNLLGWWNRFSFSMNSWPTSVIFHYRVESSSAACQGVYFLKSPFRLTSETFFVFFFRSHIILGKREHSTHFLRLLLKHKESFDENRSVSVAAYSCSCSSSSTGTSFSYPTSVTP